jgi:hypothetical protein
MGRRVESDVEWLVAHDLDTYHRYAFGTFRQCGAMAELAASLLYWLTNHGVGYLDGSTALWRELAVSMKALEFTVARLVRGRDYDIHRAFGEAAALWADATESLVSELG